MRLALGSDHAGYPLKQELAEALRRDGHEVIDVGTHSTAPVDYPDSAQAVGEAVLQGRAERGVLICGSGVGASVAANKLRGIRAAICHDSYSAHQGVEHDDMNVLVLGARVVGGALAQELARAFVAAHYTAEERHARRLAKVLALERKVPMPTNPVATLRSFGQSVWLDFIQRSLITSGALKRMVEEDALGGVTSNPAIFEKAMAGTDYASALETLAREQPGLSPKDVYERLAIQDIQDAADVLRPVYDRTRTLDGYVSLEVAPDLAHDTAGTVAEARRLWKAVARPNVMIKVPATPAGVPAIRTLLSEGINVNITLLFGRAEYEAVAHAFIEGLEQRAAGGAAIGGVASVASFFVSRIDTLVDTWIGEKLETATGAEKASLEGLLGKVAIANAKLAYESYRKIFSGARWEALRAKGAQTQRVLWASTGTKNPRYSDVLYVEELIGPDTVNTVPPDTLSAYRDHGKPHATLGAGLAEARRTLETLDASGISLKKATDELLVDAVKKFVDPFQKLLKAVEERSRAASRA